MFYGLEVCRDFDIKLLRSKNERSVRAKESKEPVKMSKESETKKRKSAPQEPEMSTDSSTEKKKTKSKKKKTSRTNTDSSRPVEDDISKKDETGESSIDDDRFLELQQAWGNVLHSRLETALYHRGFFKPTPIQAAALQPAILGRRNIVGAAPTGSGKTLAFILPILNHILQEEDMSPGTPPQAIIVTPTRELATQIYHECNKLAPNTCMTLVGGIALVKQARILATKRPPILIGTPGRLWAMVSLIA